MSEESRRCIHGSAQKIIDKCPACGARSLFVGSGGYLTCGVIGCEEPATGHVIDELVKARDLRARSETQASISEWAEATFGPASSNARVAARANEEMAELLRHLTADDAHPEAGEEIADVVIVFQRLATRLGVDLGAAIDRKMAVNRARKWNVSADGHGYHVRDRAEDSGHV